MPKRLLVHERGGGSRDRSSLLLYIGGVCLTVSDSRSFVMTGGGGGQLARPGMGRLIGGSILLFECGNEVVVVTVGRRSLLFAH